VGLSTIEIDAKTLTASFEISLRPLEVIERPFRSSSSMYEGGMVIGIVVVAISSRVKSGNMLAQSEARRVQGNLLSSNLRALKRHSVSCSYLYSERYD
jgi:hypothetical protein